MRLFKIPTQQGRRTDDARSVHGVREHGSGTRTQLVGFFNRPPIELQGDQHAPHIQRALSQTVGHTSVESFEDVVGYLPNKTS